jgi:hypothetical protein|tara:strand:- start:312 stop:656 length:345 start_codon:yes stop_codon:yes gene_type:complete
MEKKIIMSRHKVDGQYQQAYDKAPEDVKLIILDFMKLPKEQRTEQALLWYVLGQSTAPYKMSKAVANYSDIVQGQKEKCGNCQFQYLRTHNNKYICSQMRGEIMPSGWCKLWEG